MFLQAVPLLLVAQMFQMCVAGSGSFPSGGRDVVTADVGQTVKLSCELLYELSSQTHVFWYKQRVDETPTVITTTGCTHTVCRGTLERGSGYKTSILEIRDVQAEDWGFYYCSGRIGHTSFQKGPTLLVGDSSTDKTSLLVLVPPFEPSGPVPLLCLVSDLSSNMVVVYWDIAGQLADGRSDTGTAEPDQSYSVRSQVLVPSGVWRGGGVCTCVVQLGGVNKTRTKSVSRPIPTTPTTGMDCVSTFARTVSGLVLVLVGVGVSGGLWVRGRRGSRTSPGPHTGMAPTLHLPLGDRLHLPL
ncbi:immunoglobulin lambda-1 light chain-like [Rhinoraja longicauda]